MVRRRARALCASPRPPARATPHCLAPVCVRVRAGDIVIPGVFLALLLRFDALTALRSGGFRLAGYAAPVKPGSGVALDDPVALSGADFARPLFNTGLLAYALGLVVTVAVMVLYDQAQPALLYLVPAVLLAAAGASLALGRFRALMFDYADEQYAEEVVKGGVRGAIPAVGGGETVAKEAGRATPPAAGESQATVRRRAGKQAGK